MIDLTAIPDDKPRKGPHRMSKSVKCEARALYKQQQHRDRFWSWWHRRLDSLEMRDYRQRIISSSGIPLKYNPGSLLVD